MVRLLKVVSAGPEAEEVHKHHREVRRQIFASDERREVKRIVREAPEGLLPWRQVVDPHPDVREGRYQEAELAALRLVTALAVEMSEEWVTGRRCLDMEELREHRRLQECQAEEVMLVER